MSELLNIFLSSVSEPPYHLRVEKVKLTAIITITGSVAYALLDL